MASGHKLCFIKINMFLCEMQYTRKCCKTIDCIWCFGFRFGYNIFPRFILCEPNATLEYGHLIHKIQTKENVYILKWLAVISRFSIRYAYDSSIVLVFI